MNMLCYLLTAAAILILASMIIRKSWLAILTIFFIFGFFIIWLFVSAADLIPEKENMFNKNIYLDCYINLRNCTQDFFKNLK